LAKQKPRALRTTQLTGQEDTAPFMQIFWYTQEVINITCAFIESVRVRVLLKL
jgi:hypothetical protein